ncbi:MAG: hypothetical protein QOF71_1327 [Candidatus Eremiobacteraeota bacterium]|jgi:hypothetical protein|nr:hypothetical protein [Candidatus Eremiobacteraeota bacterium]
MDDFDLAARGFRAWIDAFDPACGSADDVAAAFERVLDKAPRAILEDQSPPWYRIWKPNAVWQDNQRKVAALPFNGYRTEFVPNHDETGDTKCALSYDVADVYEQLESLELNERQAYLDYVSWGYTNLRIRAAVDAVRSGAAIADPFERRLVKGRALRFVSWRSNSSTHASEDAEDIRGATTLCGGRLAFHKHTQQQWSCYACEECRCAADGVEYKPRWPTIRLVVRDESSDDGPDS